MVQWMNLGKLQNESIAKALKILYKNVELGKIASKFAIVLEYEKIFLEIFLGTNIEQDLDNVMPKLLLSQ